MLSACLLLIALTTTSSNNQSCNPAVVDYIIRDEKGVVLTEAEVNSVAELLPKTIDDATVDTTQISFTADKQKYYWPENAEWDKGSKVPALGFANAATCTLHLTEVTLTYHGKKMRLIFNIDIARQQDDRRPVIDSLPFKEGSFALDLKDWTRERDQLIPAARWKKVE